MLNNHTSISCPQTLGIRFRTRTFQFTGPRESLWRKQYFSKHAILSCTAPGPPVPYNSTHCLHNYGRIRSTLYTRCTLPKTHMPVHLARLSTMMQTAYSSPAVLCFTGLGPVHVPQAVHTNMGGPVDSCKPGVRFRRRTCQFTDRREALCRELHLRLPAALSCTPPGTRASYKSHYLFTQIWQVRYLLLH